MSDDTIDGDSLLLLLRDAIVQHSPLKDIKLILRYFIFVGKKIFDYFLVVVKK
jgi:hypothetical protein